MESVYLETTFISYLVAGPSQDLKVAGHQQTTQEWWTNRRAAFTCFVSPVVTREASAGDAAEVQKRLAVMSNLPLLQVMVDAQSLIRAITNAGILPPHAFADAAHVAVATAHHIDFLLTWNCKHLANAQIARQIRLVCDRLGFVMPTICTPDQLMGA
ncbi:MAG: type II toxin-antitoxin system VapC family toxin [Gemmataceae bacterium]